MQTMQALLVDTTTKQKSVEFIVGLAQVTLVVDHLVLTFPSPKADTLLALHTPLIDLLVLTLNSTPNYCPIASRKPSIPLTADASSPIALP